MSQPPSDDDPTEARGGPAYPPPGHGPAYPPNGPTAAYDPSGTGRPPPPPPPGGGYPSPGGGYPSPGQGPGPGRDQTVQFPAPGAGPYPGTGQGGTYGQGAPSYGQGAPPYGQAAPPYGQAAPPYGQGAPYGQPGGGYPPPGFPGGTAFGAPPPGEPGGRGKRNLVIALVAGLVLLAAVAVALVLVLNRSDDPVAAERTTAPTTEATSEPTSESPTPSPTTTEPAPTSSGGADELLAVVPAEFTDCTEAELAGDGDVAAVSCGASATQPGPQEAQFYQYEDTATLDDVFAADVDEAGIQPLPEGEDCTTAEGHTTWNVGGEVGGEVACAITDEGVVLAWTDREFGVEGVVRAPGSTQEDLAVLTEWWFTNSEYSG